MLLYDTGHIPGAVKIDWHTDLNDPHVRDYVDGEQFAELMTARASRRDDTVVIYGDKNNWWAAYALWVFTLFGHPDVRLLDGGRDKWIAEGRDTTPTCRPSRPADYPVVERDDAPIRAFKDEVLAHLGDQPLVDVRSPQEYTGERSTCRTTRRRARCAAATSPARQSIPWAKAAARRRHVQAAARSSSDLPRRARPDARRRRSSPTAASASAPATPGSC